jgi:hypothetical protein
MLPLDVMIFLPLCSFVARVIGSSLREKGPTPVFWAHQRQVGKLPRNRLMGNGPDFVCVGEFHTLKLKSQKRNDGPLISSHPKR